MKRRPLQWSAAAIALGVLVVFMTRDAEHPASSTKSRAWGAGPSDVTHTSAGPAPTRNEDGVRLDEPWPPADMRVVEEASLIESVRFEPQNPCAGDLVRVDTLLRPNARQAKVFVDGMQGSPALVEAAAPGSQSVRVLARGWDETFERRELELQVRQCDDAAPRLRLRAHAERIGEHHYVFTLQGDAPSEVRWDFGDGNEGHGARAEHRYRSNNQRPHSTYLAVAHYQGPSGPEEAPVTVTHVEASGIAARTRFPTVGNEGERFVRWDARDGLRTNRHVVNDLDEDFEIMNVEVVGFPCDGSDEVAMQLPANEVMDVTHIPAGAGIDTSVHIDGSAFERPVCEMLVRMGGLAGERLTMSTFTMDTGLPDAREPIEDPELLRQIAAIAQQRGEEGGPITAEDLALYRAAQE